MELPILSSSYFYCYLTISKTQLDCQTITAQSITATQYSVKMQTGTAFKNSNIYIYIFCISADLVPHVHMSMLVCLHV